MSSSRTEGAASWQRSRLDELPLSLRLEARPALDAELPALAEMFAQNIPDLKGTYPAFERVHRRTNAIFSVFSMTKSISGCFAVLALSSLGHERLLAGELSMAAPTDEELAGVSERADALYIWAAYMPTIGVEAMGNIMVWLRRPEYRQADMYARPTTPQGVKFVTRLGFVPIGVDAPDPSLWIGRRH
jgi:hypothetical protein